MRTRVSVHAQRCRPKGLRWAMGTTSPWGAGGEGVAAGGFPTQGHWWVSPSLHPLCPCPLGSSMPVSRLEPEVQARIREKDPQLETVYFNKGL